MRFFRALPACLVLACSGPTAPPAGHGVATPLVLEKDAGPAPLVEAGASEARFDLEEFTPLLALPELAGVSAKVENGSLSAAAKELEKFLQTQASSPDVAGDPAWQYLLARIYEQGVQYKLALEAYKKAAEKPWALQSHANMNVARLLISSREYNEAFKRLEQVKPEGPIEEELYLNMGDAALGAKRLDEAIRYLTKHLEGRQKPTDEVNAAERLALAHLERAGTKADNAVEDYLAAFKWARLVRVESPNSVARRERGEKLEAQALAALPAGLRKEHERMSLHTELARVRALAEAGLDRLTDETAEAVLSELPKEHRYAELACEIHVLRAKALSSMKKNGLAADSLAEPIRLCKGEDLRARLLYLAGTYAVRDGRHTQATQLFLQLEKEAPKHRLADDARMKAAFSFYELGVEKKFTELLSTMDRDYPDGDMVLDGVFRLAMRRIEKGDWSGAVLVLERAATLARPRDAARGGEFSGRERYFLARALFELGEKERAQQELEAIVRELPLSYYMLHAYSRLHQLDAARARQVRDEAMDDSTRHPFRFEQRPEFSEPGFLRALELARVGDVLGARREISALGIAQRGAAPGVLWGVALLYAKAGSARLSHGVARGLLSDWPARWPAGDWIRAWEIAFPRPYLPLVKTHAARTQVPEQLIYAVMREESAFDPSAASPARAYGLMQVIVPTAKLYAKGLPYDSTALRQPNISITLGSRVLQDLSKIFQAHPLLAIPGYNAGPGRPRTWLRERPDLDFDLWVEAIPFNETRRYTKRVLASRAAYAVLYDAPNAEQALLLPIRIKR